MPLGANFFDQTHFPYLDGYPDDFVRPARRHAATCSGRVSSTAPGTTPRTTDFWADAARADAGAACLHRPGADGRGRLQPLRVGHVPAPHRQLPDGPRGRSGQRRAAARRAAGAPLRRRSTRCSQPVGDVVDIIRFGDDLGMDNGPLMSPDDVSDHLQAAPCRAQRLRPRAQRPQDVPALLRFDLRRCCRTSSRPAWTSSTRSRSPRGTWSPSGSRREFGDDITFWGGGADTRKVLPKGTPGRGQGPRAPQHRGLRSRRRFRLRARAQHAPGRAARRTSRPCSRPWTNTADGGRAAQGRSAGGRDPRGRGRRRRRLPRRVRLHAAAGHRGGGRRCALDGVPAAHPRRLRARRPRRTAGGAGG